MLYTKHTVEKSKKDFNGLIVASIVGGVFVIALGVFYIFPNQILYALVAIKGAGIQLASVVLRHDFRSVAEIKSNYADAINTNSSLQTQKKVRILIVPGHEPGYGGSEYASLKERDMTVELGMYLRKFLENDSHYEVFITRDTEVWHPDFTMYFKNNWTDIAEWTKASREEFSSLVSLGSVARTVSTVVHNNAPKSVALRLYGITKWANENAIDITIHIHFNDNPRRNTSIAGKYSGFSIYVPASQYGNSSTTRVIASTIFNRLGKYNSVSNLKGESVGIIDEPDLIAIGANNTADSASMLIEYSYIYEPQFQDSQVSSLAIKDLAFQTYLGLQDFFDPSTSATRSLPDTSILPYEWSGTLLDYNSSGQEVYALQTAMMGDGVYPPLGKDKNDCSRSGGFGPCTRASLEAFQNKYKITGETGVVGKKTLVVLKGLDL